MRGSHIQRVSNDIKRDSQNVNTKLSQKEAQTKDDTGNLEVMNERNKLKERRHGI